jgi:hypothetical protein
MPNEVHTATRVAPDGPRLSFEYFRSLISVWSAARSLEEFHERSSQRRVGNVTVGDHQQAKKRRDKSMSRRTGQSGYLEKSGKWWVVRWRMDIPGQDKRALRREKICPVKGPGSLSESARKRRAREIIAQRGADTEAHFNKVVKQARFVTFREQAAFWFEQSETRMRKPVADSTLESWEHILRNWINPQIGDLPLSEVNNAALKRVVSAMVEGGVSPQTIANYTKVIKMVVSSAVDEEGEEIYPRKWNHKFVDMPVIVKAKQNTPCFSPEVVSELATYSWEDKWMRALVILCAAAGLRIGEALGLEIDKHISPDFQTLSMEQKMRKGKVENRLKTESSYRQVDLHPAIAVMLQEFIGGAKVDSYSAHEMETRCKPATYLIVTSTRRCRS